MIELPARLAEKIEPEPNTGCWLWLANCVNGYGRIKWRRDGRWFQALAHRIIYALLRGDVPVDLTLDHLCRMRSCVNPAHLEPVTNRVNILRGTGCSARNQRKTHCPQGHAYTPENTVLRRFPQAGRVVIGRVCRTCISHHRSPEARARRNAKRKALYWSRAEHERATARERHRTRQTAAAHAMPGESGSA